MPALEFKKTTGDIFAALERMPQNAFLYAQWIGIQNLETIQKGGNAYLNMMREQPCSKLLNCHSELIGPWDVAHDWITSYWTPTAISLGLQYMAQVLAPGIYGKTSFHMLHQRIGDMLEIKLFDDATSARKWLESIPVSEGMVA